MTKKQFDLIIKWQKEAFPSATAISKIEHLKEEIEELFSDVEFGLKDFARHEFADCFILLFGAAASFGMSYKDICQAIDEKMVINNGRKWSKPDANGVVYHIKNQRKN